jgi:hypothetical protein
MNIATIQRAVAPGASLLQRLQPQGTPILFEDEGLEMGESLQNTATGWLYVRPDEANERVRELEVEFAKLRKGRRRKRQLA